MSKPLYTTEILRLAAATARYARLDDPQGSADKRSPICGSRITVDVRLDEAGKIVQLGQDIRACALGQASAALMGEAAIGKSAQDLTRARDGLRHWLAGETETPGDWPGLNIFEPAIPHKARHAAIMLAFEAAAEAVESAGR
jgi:NifU-like protein involved in Fe-S cluster formation